MKTILFLHALVKLLFDKYISNGFYCLPKQSFSVHNKIDAPTFITHGGTFIEEIE